MIHGDRNRRTRPYWRRRERRLLLRDPWGLVPRTALVTVAMPPSSSAQRVLLVDLVGDLPQPSLEIGDLAGLPLRDEGREEGLVGVADRSELLVGRKRVGENLQERVEVRIGGQRRILDRVEGRRHVLQECGQFN